MSKNGELLIRMEDDQKEEFDEEAAALGISSAELGRRCLFSPPLIETVYVNDVRTTMIKIKHQLEEVDKKNGRSDNCEITDILNKIDGDCVELLKELRSLSRSDPQKMKGEKEEAFKDSRDQNQEGEEKSRSIYDDFDIW